MQHCSLSKRTILTLQASPDPEKGFSQKRGSATVSPSNPPSSRQRRRWSRGDPLVWPCEPPRLKKQKIIIRFCKNISTDPFCKNISTDLFCKNISTDLFCKLLLLLLRQLGRLEPAEAVEEVEEGDHDVDEDDQREEGVRDCRHRSHHCRAIG